MKRINLQRNKLHKILNKFMKYRKAVVGFGAPAKLTKQNRYSPGKNIKIISYDDLKNIKFSAIIIFAWNFSESIIKRLKMDFKNIDIIVPFPKLKIVKS